MSGISEERLVEIESHYRMEWSRHQDIVDSLIAEIRRLRAENKELRASYERVERVLKESVEDRAREIAQEMVDQMYPPELVR